MNKKIIIAVLLGLTLLILVTLLSQCSSKEYAVLAVQIAFDPEGTYRDGAYSMGHKNFAFKREIIKKIEECTAENNLEGICSAMSKFEYWGYENARVKALFDKSITDILQKDQENYLDNVLCLIRELDYSEWRYYSNFASFLNAQDFVSVCSENYKDIFAQNDMIAFMEYADKITRVREDLFFSMENVLPYKETEEFLKRNLNPTICVDGAGGYYDDLKYSKEYSSYYHTNNNKTSFSGSSSFFGDFLIRNSSTRYYRPTGEAWEETLMSKYDTSSQTLYYKGEEISFRDNVLYDSNLKGIYVGEFTENEERELVFFAVLENKIVLVNYYNHMYIELIY